MLEAAAGDAEPAGAEVGVGAAGGVEAASAAGADGGVWAVGAGAVCAARVRVPARSHALKGTAWVVMGASGKPPLLCTNAHQSGSGFDCGISLSLDRMNGLGVSRAHLGAARRGIRRDAVLVVVNSAGFTEPYLVFLLRLCPTRVRHDTQRV